MMKAKVHMEVARRPRMFPGVKKLTIPDQAMSLAEMFRRFVRREPLPQEKPAAYVESPYDLEKVAHLDVLEQEEVLAEMKESVSSKKKKLESAQVAATEKSNAVKAAKDAERAKLIEELRQKDAKDPVSK